MSLSIFPHLTTVRQIGVLLAAVLNRFDVLILFRLRWGSTLAPYMTDDEQRKRKIRISVWTLALLTLSVYGGFIVLAVLVDAGVAG